MEAISLYVHYVLNVPYYFNLRDLFIPCLRHQNVTKLHWVLSLCRGKVKHELAKKILLKKVSHSVKRDFINAEISQFKKKEVFASVAQYVLTPAQELEIA